MTNPKADESFMRCALGLALHGWGRTHPNPMVGAVIVEDGKVVAEGFHAKDGGPHAERAALAALGRPPHRGACLYVTLEPCSTQGRTGSCVEAILAAGFKRVVVGATDPFRGHEGHGLDLLRRAGVEVVAGVLAGECADLNLIYNHVCAEGSALLAGKLAMTLDGRIACRTGDSQWITGETARADVHRWRRLFPGIAVGAGTVMKDNPRLTARVTTEPEWCPVRFVFDGLLRTVVDRNLPRVYTDEFRDRTIVVTTPHGGAGYVRKLRELGVQVWVFPSPTQKAPLAEFRKRCTEEKISGVLFEGGAQLLSNLMHQRQLEYLFSYCAPMLLADEKAKPLLGGLRTERLSQALRLADVRREILGEDTLTRGRLVYPEKLQIDEATFSLG
jgi:diaminohydroxyphosphoribosylaminopyrimidine deaminase/5-amino-6-(5-phosphoribosylamino)uracil reductase